MRKLELLVVTILFLFMAACSGGGVSTSDSGGIPGGTTGGTTGGTGGAGGGGTSGGYTGPVGTVTVNISDPATNSVPTTRVPLKADVGAAWPPVWDNVRVILQQEFTDEEGFTTLIKHGIEDRPNPGPGGTLSVSFTVPATTGYTVVLLYSDVSGATHTMLAYGKSVPFNVNPGANTIVNVDINPISEFIDIIPPAIVSNNQTYSVTVVASGPVHQNNYNFQVAVGNDGTGATPFVDTYAILPDLAGADPLDRSFGVFSGFSASFTAPNRGSTASMYNIGTGYDNTYNLHFQGQFFANSSVLRDGESSIDWTFTCPNYIYNDPVLTHLVPDGGVGITPIWD